MIKLSGLCKYPLVFAGLFSAATASAAQPYLVGALNPISGAGSTYGAGMLKSIQIAASRINAAGGACGRRIKVIAADTQTSPSDAVVAAKKLVDVNNVNVVIGTWSSGVTLAVLPITKAAGIPEMSTSGAPAVTQDNAKLLSWRFNATDKLFGQIFAKIAKTEGFKRPATMAYNNASGVSVARSFARTWKQSGGKVAASVVYQPHQASYQAELQQVLSAHPDVVIMGSYLPDTTIILREWYQSGEDPNLKWIIPGWAANQNLIKALGSTVTHGVISVDTTTNAGAPTYASFAKAYQKATGSNADTNPYAAMTYDMMTSWGLAMQASCSNLSPQAVNGHIRAISGPPGTKVYSFAQGKKLLSEDKAIDYVGAFSQLDFDAEGNATASFNQSVMRAGKLVHVKTVSPDQ